MMATAIYWLSLLLATFLDFFFNRQYFRKTSLCVCEVDVLRYPPTSEVRTAESS